MSLRPLDRAGTAAAFAAAGAAAVGAVLTLLGWAALAAACCSGGAAAAAAGAATGFACAAAPAGSGRPRCRLQRQSQGYKRAGAADHRSPRCASGSVRSVCGTLVGSQVGGVPEGEAATAAAAAGCDRVGTGEPLVLSLSAAGASVLPRLGGGCAGDEAAAPRLLPAASSPVELRPRFLVSTLASSRAASRELRFVVGSCATALPPITICFLFFFVGMPPRDSPIVIVVEELVSLLLARPQACLLVASSGLCACALLHLRLWGRARELAASISDQPALSLAEAVHELWRRRAAGEPAKLVGVFEGFVTCSLEPAPSESTLLSSLSYSSLLKLFSYSSSPSLNAPRGQPCVMQSIQISKESSRTPWNSLWGWGRMESVPLVDHLCVVPFELCDAPQAGAQQGCAHVLASGAAFDVDAASGRNQQFTIVHWDPHRLLRRVERVLRVGSHVAIHGELSLEPWMGRADVRAVLRSPTAGPPFFCVHHGCKGAMSKAVLEDGRAHLRAAQLLLALAAAACAGSWWIWRRRRDRAALHRGVAPEAQERYAPSASPTLRRCCICNTRPRDCVLLDCRHQVCCLACASTLDHRAADPESLEVQVPPAAGLLPDAELALHCMPPIAGGISSSAAVGQLGGGELLDSRHPGVARCPVCQTRVRQVLKVYTS